MRLVFVVPGHQSREYLRGAPVSVFSVVPGNEWPTEEEGHCMRQNLSYRRLDQSCDSHVMDGTLYYLL